MADIDYELFKGLNIGNKAVITYGYRYGRQATFTGEVIDMDTIGDQLTQLTIRGCNSLVKTKIRESYNGLSVSDIVTIL